ncbi:(2Fe-2S)-binding protein [Candidatus Woesearchaeota archaeon]|nr:(2Fe-2S)-binding protein [Candidatus Woesearchaeota archaeon]
MAKIIKDSKEAGVKDGDFVKEGARSVGVYFGCEDGLCGTCLVEVIEGMENLSEKNEKEADMGLEGNQRLMCQCRIKHGTVKVKLFETVTTIH